MMTTTRTAPRLLPFLASLCVVQAFLCPSPSLRSPSSNTAVAARRPFALRMQQAAPAGT